MKIEKIIEENIELKRLILGDKDLLKTVDNIIEEIVKAFKNKRQVLLCGNGGSAADAQHIAAEFTGRFYVDRIPLNAEALHCNTSYLTAVANDYSFDDIYSRLVKAKGAKGDILIGISTSGNSKNIINALETANELEMITIGMTGKAGGIIKDKCKYLLNIPSDNTPRIQEAHILIGHIICEIAENTMFKNK